MSDIYGDIWIRADVVQNVFTEAQRLLADKLCPRGQVCHQREIAQFLDAIRNRIYEKAARSGGVPPAQPKAADPHAEPQKDATDSHADYLAYASRSRGVNRQPET